MAINHHSLAARLKRVATRVRKQNDAIEGIFINAGLDINEWPASNIHDVRSELKSVMAELRKIADTLKPSTPRRSAGRRPE